MADEAPIGGGAAPVTGRRSVALTLTPALPLTLALTLTLAQALPLTLSLPLAPTTAQKEEPTLSSRPPIDSPDRRAVGSMLSRIPTVLVGGNRYRTL